MRLLMLGGLSVDGGKTTRPGAASQRKALALLALLGGAGRRGLSRDKLIALSLAGQPHRSRPPQSDPTALQPAP